MSNYKITATAFDSKFPPAHRKPYIKTGKFSEKQIKFTSFPGRLPKTTASLHQGREIFPRAM
jgi:hypothetical protein